ncbi:MAG: hypothetical protein DLM60_07140 [Pseudonocardiales bacterium]|nr:MAG: hypothetical protein DLM60_07140 [Pseudonocardiales bacterium]
MHDLAAAAIAAGTGAASTEALRARRGRSTYVGDVAVGVLDPGAGHGGAVFRIRARLLRLQR